MLSLFTKIDQKIPKTKEHGRIKVEEYYTKNNSTPLFLLNLFVLVFLKSVFGFFVESIFGFGF